MKVLTILGTRPEIIRLSLIMKKLDLYCEHVIAHTGQNYSNELNEIFFSDLGLRKPDHYFGVRSDTFGEQIAKILIEAEKLFQKEAPDKLLILGDTNSALVSIIAKRMGIPVYHMEAGNRCYDDRVPEEVNRRIIDHSSTVLMPYTQNSKDNLIMEGIPNKAIHVIGNPIGEVIQSYEKKISGSKILEKLGLGKKKYFLVTAHREENVDIPERLKSIVDSLDKIAKTYNLPVICSLHPRTKDRMKKNGIELNNKNVQLLAPMGFFDFISLEKNAYCVISDSGTVQEECCLFRTPNITIRDVTERPETIACGSNILAGVDAELILKNIEVVTRESVDWNIPQEYREGNVSTTVIKILMGL